MIPEQHLSKIFHGMGGHAIFQNIDALAVCAVVHNPCIPVLRPQICSDDTCLQGRDPTCIKSVHGLCSESSIVVIDMLPFGLDSVHLVMQQSSGLTG